MMKGFLLCEDKYDLAPDVMSTEAREVMEYRALELSFVQHSVYGRANSVRFGYVPHLSLCGGGGGVRYSFALPVNTLRVSC
jgi:hypothetical protein